MTVDVSNLEVLDIGDTIPKELWSLPLRVVNHPKGRDKISLAEYSDKKLIVLDFWSTYCAPCIKGITYWEDQLADLGEDVLFLYGYPIYHT